MLARGLITGRLRLTLSFTRTVHSATSSPQAEIHSKLWQPFGLPKPGPTNASTYDAAEIAMQKKAKIQYDRALKKRKVVNSVLHLREGSNEEILQLEVEDLLKASNDGLNQEPTSASDGNATGTSPSFKNFSKEPPIQLGTEVELDIVELSSTGDGLAYAPSRHHVVAVPFSVPGDRVLARVYKWLGTYSQADFIKVIEPSQKREGVTPPCKYFADCGGCQFQMIPYAEQLAHKKTIVERAFSRFSGLAPDQIPPVRDTMGSPIQYHYRTKLSPHFDGPNRRKGETAKFTSLPKVGYNRKNRREVLDIEHCPIGTDVLQEGLKIERAKVAVNYKTYRNGKTILLRESTTREHINPETQQPRDDGGDHDNNNNNNNNGNSPTDSISTSPVAEFDTTTKPTSTTLTHLPDGRPEILLTFPDRIDKKTYTSVETSLTTEYIGPHKFVNRAGSFFQNNNSILGPFTKYVYDNCIPPSPPAPPTASTTTTTSSSEPTASTPTLSSQPPIKYLLDAYCGSGLFTITLSNLFTSALGIDIDPQGIDAARSNATTNQIPNAGFIEADASDLFADVPFPPAQSLVVIDPPRKGASADFLKQLCQFGPRRVIYVSCNVHTQARDVGMIVQGFGEGTGWRYEIESLRGFDFFPQTGHVEGVCVLNRVGGV